MRSKASWCQPLRFYLHAVKVVGKVEFDISIDELSRVLMPSYVEGAVRVTREEKILWPDVEVQKPHRVQVVHTKDQLLNHLCHLLDAAVHL